GEEPKVGDSSTVHKSTPTLTKGGGIKFASLTGGISVLVGHVCGVGLDKAVYCWGVNSVVDTSATPKNLNANVPTRYGSDIPWKQVAPGQAHNCALAEDQNIYCWGDNAAGQLGDRLASLKRNTPAPVFGGFKFQSVTSGRTH